MNDQPPRTLASLLSFRARESRAHPALVASGRTASTYEALDRQARRLRTRLAQVGIGPRDRLALVLPDGPEMAAAFLTLGASVALAPLNPAYRAEELDFYLSDLAARAVVVPVGGADAARLVARQRGLPLLEVRVPANALAGEFDLVQVEGPVLPSLPEPAEPTADDVALLLHTSGTTARPKLVPLSHRNVCASGRNIARTLALGPADRCLCVMPLFHIHGLIGALLSSLTAGATVACTPGFAAARFFDELAEFQPTWYSAVPTMHQAILERAASLDRAQVGIAPLRLIRSSSAALPPPVMQRLEALFGVPVVESYGMTEAAHQMASNPLPPLPRKPGSVGLPAGPDIAILDDRGQPLPQGTNGEVCIRGENVTAGYDHNPAANATAFTGDGWFRTGDQGHLDADGYLVLTGRLKEIVNRGGEKIGPREIDEVLLQHPGIRQAVAFAVPHPTLGEDLVAAIVTTVPAPTEGEIRAFLLERLPAFKVPTRVLLLSEIPKGPTGKVQRLGLAERLAAHFRVEFQPPEPGLESNLADIFREVLALERIGRHDHFFSLGGDSLRATRAIARMRRALGVQVPLPAFFRNPTVAGLAQVVAELKNAAAPPDELDDLASALAEMSLEERERWLNPPADGGGPR